MKDKPTFNFRFHNPNSPEATLGLLLSVFVEVQKEKADRAIRDALTLAYDENKVVKDDRESSS